MRDQSPPEGGVNARDEELALTNRKSTDRNSRGNSANRASVVVDRQKRQRQQWLDQQQQQNHEKQQQLEQQQLQQYEVQQGQQRQQQQQQWFEQAQRRQQQQHAQQQNFGSKVISRAESENVPAIQIRYQRVYISRSKTACSGSRRENPNQ